MTARPRRNTRPRDALGRPLPYGSSGVETMPEGIVRTPSDSVAEARRLLDAGRPFHAHEVLEDAWKNGPDAESSLWRGLAQLAVGITHAARGNLVGAARLIERGTTNVAPYAADPPHGLDVEAIVQWSRAAVVGLGDAAPGAVVELSGPSARPSLINSAEVLGIQRFDAVDQMEERAGNSRAGHRPALTIRQAPRRARRATRRAQQAGSSR